MTRHVDSQGRELRMWDVVRAIGHEDTLIVVATSNVNGVTVANTRRGFGTSTVRGEILTLVHTATGTRTYRTAELSGVEVRVTALDADGLALCDSPPPSKLPCVQHGCNHQGVEKMHPHETGVWGWLAELWVDRRPAARRVSSGRPGPVSAAENLLIHVVRNMETAEFRTPDVRWRYEVMARVLGGRNLLTLGAKLAIACAEGHDPCPIGRVAVWTGEHDNGGWWVKPDDGHLPAREAVRG